MSKQTHTPDRSDPAKGSVFPVAPFRLLSTNIHFTMRTYALLLIFIFQPFGAAIFAQSGARVIGELRTSDNKAVAGATVSLVKESDSSLVKMAVSDETGKFELDAQGPGTYMLRITCIGFMLYRGPAFDLDSSGQIVLPPIQMQQSSPRTLKTVDVSASKPYIERKIDRTVVNVDALISNAGANAFEVLEKAPGVQVQNNSISLKGRQGVLIFIDDKPTYLSGDALAGYLRSLPSSVVERLEIMTNPPAKYDAAGSAGVINIVIKKAKVRGFNGGLTASFGQGAYWRTNNSFNFNYRSNNVNLFGNVGYTNQTDFQELDIERKYKNEHGQLLSIFSQHSFLKTKQRSGLARLGMDYYLTSKTTVGIVASGMFKPSDQDNWNTSRLINAGYQLDSSITAHSTQQDEWKNGTVNLNFRHRYDSTGKELAMDFDYLKYRAASDQRFFNQTFMPDGQLKAEDNLYGSLPVHINIYVLKADYSHPFKGNAKMNGGFKTSLVKTDNMADYWYYINGDRKIDEAKTNHFRYDENINAAYLNYSNEFGKLAMQLGLRLENTVAKGRQLGNDSSFKRNYTNLFPTVYFMYKLDSNSTNQFGLSYGRRINRPYYQDLNPFLFPIDKFTYFAGNPFLQPEMSDNIELSHTYKGILTTTLMYSHTDRVMLETIEQSNGLFISRSGNAGKRDMVVLTLDAVVHPFNLKWWTSYLYGEFTYARFNGMVYTEKLDVDGVYGMVDIGNQFRFSNGWGGDISGYYKTRKIGGQFINEPVWLLNVGVQKKILNDRATVRAHLRDIFYSVQPRGRITNVRLTDVHFHNYLNTRLLTLSFSYTFGKSFKTSKKGDSAGEEKSRVKGGN